MTTHARAERLTAAAIDFGLSPAEHAEVNDHLATCPACRNMAVGYQTDASGLRGIAHAEPPARVRTALLRAAARPPVRTIEPWKLLVAAALLLTALLGAAAAIGAWNSRPALVTVVPSTKPSAEASAGPSAVPSGGPSAGPGEEIRTITTGPFGDADGPGLTVSEAMANAGRLPLLVNGSLLKEVDGTAWLCGAFPVSSPPRCTEPRLRVENSQPEGSPVEDHTFDAGEGVHEESGVRWVEHAQLYGIVSAAAPSASATAFAVAEPTGDLLFFRGVAAESDRNGSAWTVLAGGGPPLQLGPAIEASWAGDGQSIHLVSQDAKCVPTLTTMSIDGQTRDTVRKDLRSGDAAFAWSPDGRQIVFIRWHTGPPAGQCGSQGGAVTEDQAVQDVIVMNADGSGQRVLVPTVWLSRPITWSPDGTRIAYVNTITNASSLLDPVVVRVADGLRTPMTSTSLDGVSIPRWSPDGTQLAFMTFIRAVKHIGVISVSGGEMRDLGSGDDHLQEPAWSPDGSSIAVAFDIASSDGTLSPGGIAIHAADGSDRRDLSLSDIQSFSEPPAWSPDGAWLAYIRTAPQKGGASDGIALVGVDSSVRREIPGTAGAQWVSWQPAR